MYTPNTPPSLQCIHLVPIVIKLKSILIVLTYLNSVDVEQSVMATEKSGSKRAQVNGYSA